MERKKMSKNDYALPQHHTNPYSQEKSPTFSSPQQPNFQAPFMKYASSIIEVISEQNLNNPSRNQFDFQNKQPIYDISEVKIFQIDSNTPERPFQMNYNQIAAKMKKKPAAQKQILVYNFSNLAILYQKLSNIIQDKVQNAFKNIFLFSQEKKNIPKIPKSTPKKSSFHSGYTASTNNQQNIFKKQKKKQNMKESANQIKGWIQFKTLIILNESFQEIFQRSKTMTKDSDIKLNKNKEVNFETSNIIDISLSKNMEHLGHHHIEESFIYTVQNISDYGAQKQLSITTPERFTKKQEYFSSFQIRSKPMETKSKENITNSKPPKSKTNIYFDKIIESKPIKISINKPIQIQTNNDRRYLIARTNCYQLPCIADYDVKSERKMQNKSNSISNDTFHRNQSQVISDFNENLKKQFEKTQDLFKSGKNCQDQYDMKPYKAGYTSGLSTKISNSKNNVSQKNIQKISIESTENKKIQPGIEVKKIENYYFPDKFNYFNKQTEKDKKNQYNFLDKESSSSNNYFKEKGDNNFDQIKSIQSIINVINQELNRKQGQHPKTQKKGQRKIQKKIIEDYPYMNNNKLFQPFPVHQNIDKCNMNSYLISRQEQKTNKHKFQINNNPYEKLPQKTTYPYSKQKNTYFSPSTINNYNSPAKYQQVNPNNINHNGYELTKKIDSKLNTQLKGQNHHNNPYNNNFYQAVTQKNIGSNYGLFLQKNNINNPIINNIRKNSNNHYLVDKPQVKSPQNRINSPNNYLISSKEKERKIVPNKINSITSYPPQQQQPQLLQQQNNYKKQQSKQKYTYFSPQVKREIYPQQYDRQERIISKVQYNQQKVQRVSSKIQYNQQKVERANSKIQLNQDKAERVISKLQYNHQRPEVSKIQYYQQRPERIPSKVQYNQQPTTNNYHQSPQPHHYRHKVQNNYFISTDKNRPEIKAINYNNNYYTNSAQRQQINNHIEQHNRKMNPQAQPQIQRVTSKLIFNENSPSRPFTRPPSCRDSYQRVNPFSNYSPLDSELLESNQKSYSSSRHNSQLNRPRSMNQKLHITLRRQR